MNLKTACKKATKLAILSFILIVAGHIIGIIAKFFQISGSQDGAASETLSLISTQLSYRIPALFAKGLVVASFITLLSACSKQQDNPLVNVKTRLRVAVSLIGIPAFFALIGNALFYFTIFQRQPNLNLSLILYQCYYLANTLCVISLFIFAVSYIKKSISSIPIIIATTCHVLAALAMTARLINMLYTQLVFDESQKFGSMSSIFQFASSMFSYTGSFLWLAAVLLFLFAYLKHLPPSQAGVLDPSPEPTPVLSTEESLPG